MDLFRRCLDRMRVSLSVPPIQGLSPQYTHNPDNRNPSAQGSYSGDFGKETTSPSVGNNWIAKMNSFSSYVAPDATIRARNEARDWFLAIDQDGDGELSYAELHHALLTTSYKPFSTTTVKYLVSIFDRNDDGVIGFEEFDPLWDYMNGWTRMFDSFDTNGDGRIDAADFGRALAYYDIHVPFNILEMVVKKYGGSNGRDFAVTESAIWLWWCTA